MAKTQFSFESSFGNFASELNTLFTDELSVVHQNCRDYESLSDVYEISSNRQTKEVNLTAVAGVQVGATTEVQRRAKILNRKYKLKLNFN